MSNTFEVVFSGEVIEGNDVAETHAKIGKLFNADEAKIARLFSGNSVVIKKDLDEATANKYIGAFKKAGARAIVRNAAAATESKVAAAETAPAASAPAPVATSKAAPAAAASNANTVFEHSGEASEHLTAAPQTKFDLDSDPDLSGLTLRENTGNLFDASAEAPDADIDISEFTLAATGSDLADKKEEVPPLNADLSGIDLVDD
ncbi:MAG: hypothetical protein KAQ67_12930 [Gammaproteobacteria bacterium]|nr:hypothetical protein [Gammaproteobacteria bacterium]